MDGVRSVVGTSTVPCGWIRWEFDKDSISTAASSSPEMIEVGGIPWRIIAAKTSSGEHLGVHLTMTKGDYMVQSLLAMGIFKLINHDDADKNIKLTGSVTVEHPVKNFGVVQLVEWQKAIDEEQGFIKDNKLTVAIDFSLSNIVGFRKFRRIDFTDSSEPLLDVALVIGGEKVYVGKQFLSTVSPYFQTMFFGDLAEKNKDEIELKDVDYKDFTELLEVLYPPHKSISAQNCGILLKLSDRFEIYAITKLLEQFLITSVDITMATRLLLSDQFHLFDLKEHCFNELKKRHDVAELKKTAESKKFSDELNLTLFEKMLKLSD
ncbi:hypothetical protein PMAYCL1PPCAC_24772 [Pristionchus mayeri]|uniref:BTB domain-containing protein n=1 Tax=Pristionchus mayeri TaxID=1317129 RepID=A0AAN5D2K7_9BILA|nr:hypothetical protein PMAYCL1PPCAC_24772 [Pristionchus mayeri]